MAISIALAFGSGVVAEHESDANSLLDAMQGTWILSMSEAYGHTFQQNVGKEMLVIGNQMQSPKGTVPWTFTLNTGAVPTQIDFSAPADQKISGIARVHGIVAVEDGTLKVCFTHGLRPKSFSSKRAWLLTWSRKPAKKEP